LILLPGDSPVGLRLPLGSLPVVKSHDHWPERSTFEELPPLPARKAIIKALGNKTADTFAKDPVGLVRTALCAEVRGGTLHLFLPPVEYGEHFCELIAAIENVANRTQNSRSAGRLWPAG